MLIVHLLVLQVLTFIALLVVLRVLFQHHLSSAFGRLKGLQEDALIKESQLREELERARQEKASEIEKGKTEAKKIIAAARKEAELVRADIEEQAKKTKEEIIEQGKENIDRLKQALDSDMKAQALDLATDMVKYIFSDKGHKALQQQLLEEVIEEVEKIEKNVFPTKARQGIISTSFSLSEQEKQRIDQVLLAKVGPGVKMSTVSDPELIAGLVIQIGDFVIDGTIRNKLQKVIPYLKNMK
jgi:F-type H+-transporting ATPase subunit b